MLTLAIQQGSSGRISRTSLDMSWQGRHLTLRLWSPARLPGRGPLPLLLYAPGWNGRANDNTALAHSLAASGYIVAALDDLARLLPAGDAHAGRMDFSSEDAARRTEAMAAAKTILAASLASSVLDRLASLDAPGSGSDLTGAIDLTRAGMFGFSFGGAVAAQAAWRDKRLRAVLNMDGWLFADAARDGPGVPYFSINDGEALPGATDLAASDPARRNQARLTLDDSSRQHAILSRSGGYELSLAGTSHADFSDQGWSAWLFGGFGRNHARVASIVASYATAFFDQTLKGQAPPLLRADAPRPGAERFVVWTAPSEQPAEPQYR